MKPLEFTDIHRAFRAGTDVLSGVTFSLEEGQVVGLLGKNGAGKTTLIHVAVGLLRAQRGSVRVFGKDPTEESVETKRRIGFVSENQLTPSGMRVGDVIDFHRELFPTWDAELETRLRERFEFGSRAKVRTLSKGQARQLSLLCAVAHRPKLLLLDEPAGGLDPAARRQFLETSIDLLAQSGTSILFSSHHMTDVERMADRIVLLDRGKVLLDRPLDTLREEYSIAVVPANGRLDESKLAATHNCVRVRRHRATLHAVFHEGAEIARERIESSYGVRDVSCRHVPLEELFIELLGESS